MAYDLNFGAGSNVTPYNFTVPTGLGVADTGGYSSLNGFGMSSPTLGANASDLTPATSTQSGLFGVQGLGANIPTFQLGLGALGTGFNLYSGLKALGLAKDTFDFQKQLAQKNLANQTASYNTALTDRATARAVTEGQSAADRDAYIAANKLS
ncbi:hypothetical protein [Caballeronia sp. LZ034LL]|uniref:hypothetical protein n=1 Tax=Caballeronia sp. LZ034LL TaxID=3038567 RepID=UPI002859099E|nr:hypothetical protein [Caballeronia sp. LZ034LL]MDR5839315.1 hypothetical protein [Caballeronia sp. LZ034LL]